MGRIEAVNGRGWLDRYLELAARLC